MASPENTLVSTAGSAVASAVIKAAPGTLRKLHVVRSGGTGSVYVQVFNSATVPADTAVPVWRSGALATPGDVTLDFGDDEGLFCDTGISVCISTTVGTKTVGSAEAFFHALVD